MLELMRSLLALINDKKEVKMIYCSQIAQLWFYKTPSTLPPEKFETQRYLYG